MTEKELSQYDLGGVLKSAHDDKNDALRVTNANTSVPSKYSRVDLTYNASGSVTNAKFYKGTYAEVREITFVDDVGGSLNNTYFPLYSENDESLYHVWYNVNGAGVDPAPANSQAVEVEINTNEQKEVVALATKLALEKIEDFKVDKCLPYTLRVVNTRKGLATDTVDSGTGFKFVVTLQGAECLIKSVEVPFDGESKYLFNTQEKRFENFPISETTVELTGEVDIKDPNTMVIINTTLALKNTEYTIALPDDTKRYELTIRNNAKINLAFVATETATNYKTIKAGNIWDSRPIDIPNSTTIYVRSNKDNTIIETVVWRRV
jgi:hypothetical protein